MSASTAARVDVPRVRSRSIPYPVKASTKIWSGTLVMLISGYLTPGLDTSGGIFVGEAIADVDNSGGSDGDLTCDVIPPSELEQVVLNATSPTVAAWLGQLVYLVDDNVVALVATTTNDVVVGRVTRVLNTSSAGRVQVDVRQRV